MIRFLVLVLCASSALAQLPWEAASDNAVLGPSGGLEAEVNTYSAAIVSAGSTISPAQLAAVNSFVIGCKTDGVWSKMQDVGTFTGTNLTAALVKLKNYSGAVTSYTNNNFVAGDYTEATGLKGNGSTKYLATGVVPSTMMTINSTHYAQYNRAVVIPNDNPINLMGAGSAAGASLVAYIPYSDRKYYAECYNTSTSYAISASAYFGPLGVSVITKPSLGGHFIYRNAVQVATQTVDAGALPTAEVHIFKANETGSAYSAAPLSFVSIGNGLSSTDVTNLTNRLHILQTALGRSPELVIAEGDSITTGNGIATPYASTVATTLGQPPLYLVNDAVASSTITGGSTPSNSMTTRAAAMDALYSTTVYRKNIISGAGGHNDIAQGKSAATAYADFKAWCLARRTAGYKVIACTLLPSTASTGGASFNSIRNDFNTLVRGDSSFYDVLCDFGANATIGGDAVAVDTTYYPDGTHLSQAAQDAIAPDWQAAVTTALAL